MIIIQTDILTAIVEQMPAAPAKRTKRSLGPRPPWTRFWEKVSREGECWIWSASTYDNGYGQFTVLGKPIKAHRWAYQNLVGRIPAGMQLDHLCHTNDKSCLDGKDCPHRRCVNPAHLQPVAGRVNTLRGRGIAGHNARKTHCDTGHPFDAGNTRFTREGHRVCRRCHWISADKQRKLKRPPDGRPPT